MRDRDEWADRSRFNQELGAVKGALGWNDVDLSMLIGVHRFTLSKWRKTNSPADFQAYLVTSLSMRSKDWTYEQKARALDCLKCYGPGEALAILLRREFWT